MVTTFRASEAFAGALELTGKATLVALINRCIGAVIRYMLIAVIPDIFQRLQVVLNVWILAVANSILSYGFTFFSTSRWKLLV